jgi:hypothetical protein
METMPVGVTVIKVGWLQPQQSISSPRTPKNFLAVAERGIRMALSSAADTCSVNPRKA